MNPIFNKTMEKKITKITENILCIDVDCHARLCRRITVKTYTMGIPKTVVYRYLYTEEQVRRLFQLCPAISKIPLETADGVDFRMFPTWKGGAL